MKNKKEGFTLIELLAVIIILGVLMIIAIPSVTEYINSSRKSAYITIAQQYISSVKNKVNAGEFEMYDTDVTYYVPTKCVSLEKGGDSPFGAFDKAYVLVTYSGNSYNYYWTSRDEVGIGIKNVTPADQLEESLIESNIKEGEIAATTSIGDRASIIELNESLCTPNEKIPASTIVGDNGESLTNLISQVITKDGYENSSTLNYGTSNGTGTYVFSGTEDSKHPIYFYRGNVTNNNVIFAGYCWKIVRTTESGGTKIIYNGTPSNGTCNNTGEATQITTAKYSLYNKDNTYMGYMYGKEGATSYSEAHSNSYDSNVKSEIDKWYSSNMTAYTKYLEDTVWCNDRSIAPDSQGEGFGTNATNYYGRYRLNINKTPSLTCANNNDKYTTTSSKGNGKLRYPVALLTADEASLAGSVWNQESSYYLNSGTPWWTMTPSRLNGNYPSIFVVLNTGGLYAHSGNLDGIRPVVSLKSTVQFKDGGDGTTSNPYVIKN